MKECPTSVHISIGEDDFLNDRSPGANDYFDRAPERIEIYGTI